MSNLIAAGVFAATALLLCLHHGWEHDDDDPETSLAKQESCRAVCYFQLSDVGNFRTCNHEMWILLFFALAVMCLLWPG
jgi:hypothetical protein